MSGNSKRGKKDDDMHAEYDFSNAVRGKYVKRFSRDVVMVTLAPDVAAAFPDAAAVNEALRLLQYREESLQAKGEKRREGCVSHASRHIR